jgi:hypothetical protein
VHQATPDLLHGHALQFDRRRAGLSVEPDTRTSSKLLGAERRHVHEEKAAFNGRGRFERNVRGRNLLVRVGSRLYVVHIETRAYVVHIKTRA